MNNTTQGKLADRKAIPYTDEILLECWRIKDELSAKYGHDLDKLFAGMREREKQSELAGRRVVDLSGEPKLP